MHFYGILNNWVENFRALCTQWSSSPPPLKIMSTPMKGERFEACGTLQSNRKGIPEKIKVRKRESHFSKDEFFLFIKWTRSSRSTSIHV